MRAFYTHQYKNSFFSWVLSTHFFAKLFPKIFYLNKEIKILKFHVKSFFNANLNFYAFLFARHSTFNFKKFVFFLNFFLLTFINLHHFFLFPFDSIKEILCVLFYCNDSFFIRIDITIWYVTQYACISIILIFNRIKSSC